MLVLAAVLLLAVFFIFPGLLGAIIKFLGWVCCFLLSIVLIIVVLVFLASIFSIPIFLARKPPKTDYYSNYRVEDVGGMDDDPANKNGPPGRP